jgi:hypothetical protein
MGDDLSMFLAVGALLHQLLCFEATPAQRLQYTFAILGSLIPVSVYHVWADEIYVHEIVFAIMVFMVSRRVRALIKRRVKSEESKKRLGAMATFGVCEFCSMCCLCWDFADTLQRRACLDTSCGLLTSICASTSQLSNTPLVYPGASSSSCMGGGIFSQELVRIQVWHLLSISLPLNMERQVGLKRGLSGLSKLC